MPGICITAEPRSIVEVWPASQARTLGLSEPYASAAQTDGEAETFRVPGEREGLGRVGPTGQVAEVEREPHRPTVSGRDRPR